MPPIEGNFNDTLDLLWDGKGVAARGPLEWGNEEGSVSLHVAIMQNGGSAIGRTGDDLPHGAGEFLIAAAVSGTGTLKAGPAIATGLALVRADRPEMYQWSKPVTLKAKAKAKPKPKPKAKAKPKPKAKAKESAGFDQAVSLRTAGPRE
jgi:hypothetical protein